MSVATAPDRRRHMMAKSPERNLQDVVFFAQKAQLAITRLEHQADTWAQRTALKPLRGCVDATLLIARNLSGSFK